MGDDISEDAAVQRTGDDERAARSRLRTALAPRATVQQLVIGLLFVALGFAGVAATQSSSASGLLATAREDEVVRVLDDLTERQARLQAEQRALEAARDRLLSGSEEQRLAASRARADALAILAGTVPATGTGIRITLQDGGGAIGSAVLLDAVQELRDAGAEAIQIGTVRVVASTWFEDAPTGVSVSGTVLASPYRILVIGDPSTLATALEIPGGVADTVRTAGGRIEVVQDEAVVISALQPLSTPQYARPAPSPSGS
ncbi:MAG: DUF881 domain-containing protein [Candidatus Nanopelagicales bacterium]